MDFISGRAATTASVRSAASTDAEMSEDSFRAVVAAGAAGEGWALASLYRAVQPSLLGYLKAREPSVADDLASETWINVAEGITSFRGSFSGFRSWVFTIARCRLADHRRRGARGSATVTDLDRLAAEGPCGDPEAETMDALGAGEAIRRITRLPADQADVVLLRVIGGLNVEEVAAIIGKKRGTVRVIQHRALRRLARDLAGDAGISL